MEYLNKEDPDLMIVFESLNVTHDIYIGLRTEPEDRREQLLFFNRLNNLVESIHLAFLNHHRWTRGHQRALELIHFRYELISFIEQVFSDGRDFEDQFKLYSDLYVAAHTKLKVMFDGGRSYPLQDE